MLANGRPAAVASGAAVAQPAAMATAATTQAKR